MKLVKLTELGQLVGEEGKVKLTWASDQKWVLFVVTSDGTQWVSRDRDLEHLCRRCLSAFALAARATR